MTCLSSPRHFPPLPLSLPSSLRPSRINPLPCSLLPAGRYAVRRARCAMGSKGGCAVRVNNENSTSTCVGPVCPVSPVGRGLQLQTRGMSKLEAGPSRACRACRAPQSTHHASISTMLIVSPLPLHLPKGFQKCSANIRYFGNCIRVLTTGSWLRRLVALYVAIFTKFQP